MSLMAASEPAYRTWKDGINDRPPMLADGFPPPDDWRLEAMLRRLYAMPQGAPADA